ncbi:MAG: hypothetical protein RR847_03750 [Bacilli bacterium]
MQINIKKQIKGYKSQHKKQKSNLRWILNITIAAFFISLFFSFSSETIIPNVNIIIGIILVIIFIFLGILFDMIGIAVTAADEAPFHSMSSRKIKSANVAVVFKKNADKVSSFCNDVIGDICGIISGSAGVIIASKLSIITNVDILIVTLVITAIIASLTIGGKAIGKHAAINNSNIILYEFAKTVAIFYQPKNKKK